MDDETRARFDQIDTQCQAAVSRIENIEEGMDCLAAKIDRQAVMTSNAMLAAEQAVTLLIALRRRLPRF